MAGTRFVSALGLPRFARRLTLVLSLALGVRRRGTTDFAGNFAVPEVAAITTLPRVASMHATMACKKPHSVKIDVGVITGRELIEELVLASAGLKLSCAGP